MPNLWTNATDSESATNPTLNENEAKSGVSVDDPVPEMSSEPEPLEAPLDGNNPELSVEQDSLSLGTDTDSGDVEAALSTDLRLEESVLSQDPPTEDVTPTETLDENETDPLNELGGTPEFNMSSGGIEDAESLLFDPDSESEAASEFGDTWDMSTIADSEPSNTFDSSLDTSMSFETEDLSRFDDTWNRSAIADSDAPSEIGAPWDLSTDMGEEMGFDSSWDTSSVDGASTDFSSSVEAPLPSGPLEMPMESSPIIAEPMAAPIDDYMPMDSPF